AAEPPQSRASSVGRLPLRGLRRDERRPEGNGVQGAGRGLPRPALLLPRRCELGLALERFVPLELDVAVSPEGSGDAPRRRQSDRDDDTATPGRVDPAAPSGSGDATWGGEGGAGDSRGGPVTSPGDAARDPQRDPQPDPEGNPELM